MKTFASFKREAPGRRCKIIKSEYRGEGKTEFTDISHQQKNLNLVRTIKNVRSRDIVFEVDGKESFATATASDYQQTDTGFILNGQYTRLTYVWVESDTAQSQTAGQTSTTTESASPSQCPAPSGDASNASCHPAPEGTHQAPSH